jgi:N utilization substance protein B
MKQRTRARSLALQVLYEVDLSSHPPGQVFTERLADEPIADELAEFARKLVFGVLPLKDYLDDAIATYAPEWPLEQVAPIDLNILRIAFWEFGINKKTPVKVAINEAVELAKLYGSETAPGFVNGVLGSLAKHQDEIAKRIQKELNN